MNSYDVNKTLFKLKTLLKNEWTKSNTGAPPQTPKSNVTGPIANLTKIYV